MLHGAVIWDMDDDPDGNVQHCAEHEISKEEVEEVLECASDVDISRSSGRPVIFASATAMKPAPPSLRQVTRSMPGCACSASSRAM